MPASITLSVYFSGTAHGMYDSRMLATLLYDNTKVDDITSYKMGFNGCGVDYGLSGMLFGAGLDEQCYQVIDKISELLKQGQRVKLNAYGHSRGAVACLLLAKKLSYLDPKLLEINLALMDPVPGNWLITTKLDTFHRTLAQQAMDVSNCRSLKSVLAIYPYLPLSAIIAHAPILPQYPNHCQVQEQIIPGCHSMAQVHCFYGEGYNNESTISWLLVQKYMADRGTNFAKQIPVHQVEARLLECYENIKEEQETERACHAKSKVHIIAKKGCRFLSPLHQDLYEKAHGKQYGDQAEKTPQQTSFRYTFLPARPYASTIVAANQDEIIAGVQEKTPSIQKKAELLKTLLQEIYDTGMSKKSKKSNKGALLQAFIGMLAQLPAEKVIDFNSVLRNALSLCLQRDRNIFSIYSTSASGLAARKLLNTAKYSLLAQEISSANALRYRDMRCFIAGNNDEGYFKAYRAKKLYQLFQAKQQATGATGDDLLNSSFLDNHLSFYLKSR